MAGVPKGPRSLRGAKEVARSLRSAAGAKKEAGSRQPAYFKRTVTKCRIVPSAITRRISPNSGEVKGATRFRRE